MGLESPCWRELKKRVVVVGLAPCNALRGIGAVIVLKPVQEAMLFPSDMSYTTVRWCVVLEENIVAGLESEGVPKKEKVAVGLEPTPFAVANDATLFPSELRNHR